MRTFLSVFCAAASVVLMAGAIIPASAQGDDQRLAEAKVQTASYLRYFKYESKLAPKEIDRLAELRVKVHSPSTSLEDRQAALKEFLAMVFRAAGTNPMPPEQALENFAKNTGQATHRLVNDSGAKAPGGSTPLGNLGAVEKRGRGPIPMILIADIRTDWSIYRSFMDRNAERYTMYAVTLPGYGGAPAPPRPETLDLRTTPWWDGAEKGVISLIEKNRLNKPVVVGMATSSFLATRLAVNHPDKIRAAVVIDGNVYATFRSLANPDYPATLEERPDVLMKQPGAIGMISEFLPALTPSRESAEARIKALPPAQLTQFFAGVRDIERARALAIDAAALSDPRAYRYNVELFASDLTGALKNLKVPLLAIPAIHDDNSPGQGGPAPSQWHEAKMKYPAIPLTVAPFENTRTYVTEEAPQELDRAIESFLAGKPVEGRRGLAMATRPSPRGEVGEQIGALKVSITYGRPQVNKRQIWGQLVPYNRLWRAGANEATYITFSSDVLVEGQKLAAGSYSLFTIPTETEWTVVFNRVPSLWGHFYYNPEFD
ncbi:MAG TPA: alpha/beta fold hydrolase, partial [Blastocatellia bacterium]|nr:alpha/beta fold hydrolase [Blastocatellia bacterium]